MKSFNQDRSWIALPYSSQEELKLKKEYDKISSQLFELQSIFIPKEFILEEQEWINLQFSAYATLQFVLPQGEHLTKSSVWFSKIHIIVEYLKMEINTIEEADLLWTSIREIRILFLSKDRDNIVFRAINLLSNVIRETIEISEETHPIMIFATLSAGDKGSLFLHKNLRSSDFFEGPFF